jgi:hypothetical protein
LTFQNFQKLTWEESKSFFTNSHERQRTSLLETVQDTRWPPKSTRTENSMLSVMHQNNSSSMKRITTPSSWRWTQWSGSWNTISNTWEYEDYSCIQISVGTLY